MWNLNLDLDLDLDLNLNLNLDLDLDLELDLGVNLALDLGWIWDRSGVDVGSGSDPALIRHFPAPRLISRRTSSDGWRAVPPTGHILDPLLTSIRTL